MLPRRRQFLTLLKVCGVGASLVILSGCATNPMRGAYVDHTAAMPESARKELRPVKAEAVKVLWVERNNYGREVERRANQNYTLLGEAAFNGEMPPERQLVRHAQSVGADLVLFSSQMVGSAERAMPIQDSEYPNFIQSKRFGSPAYGKDVGLPMGSLSQQPGRSAIYDFEVSFWRSNNP